MAQSDDRFWRQGYGLGLSDRRVRVDLVYQYGSDARASDAGALRSSGGFAQVRYDIGSRAFGIVRYDGTQDTRFSRSFIAGAGYRVARNARFTVFDTAHRDAESACGATRLSTELLFAY